MAKYYFSDAETQRTNIIVSLNKTTPAMGVIDLTKVKGEVIMAPARSILRNRRRR